MAVSVPAVLELSDEALAAIAERLQDVTPSVTSTEAPLAAAETDPAQVEVPCDWTLTETRSGETWTWGKEVQTFETVSVYESTTPAGTVRMAIAPSGPTDAWGKERRYFVTFFVRSSGKLRPVAVFMEADDAATTGDFVAIIKGKEHRAKMYDPTDDLPAPYAGFRIETYRDRIDYSGSYEKLAVVAREDDVVSMLGHTLIQAQTRSGFSPA